ncbi:hypothetical protein N7528_009838 [Penicillium herquei]|nr:hypothetical protein N7528_009838 [Penicillium herquei]
MGSLLTQGGNILISPRVRSPEDPSTNKRRKIVPSPEFHLSANLMVISPFCPIQPQPLVAPSEYLARSAVDLLPFGQVSRDLSRLFSNPEHGHPRMKPEFEASLTDGGNAPFPRQIILPFDLRQNPSKFLEPGSRQLLLDVFPHIQNVEFDERVLVYHFDQLPSKPWPKKIAGVPCFLTADPNERGPMIPIQHQSHSNINLSNQLDLRDNEAAMGLIFDLVRDFFNKVEIPITEIQFWGHIIIIVLENEGEKDKTLKAVPKSIAKCKCFYLFESIMGRPRNLSARPLKEASIEKDDSTYQTMRPGVMISSGKHPIEGHEMLTSSGVLVKDRIGNEYMTVAAHGFPGYPFDGNVYHPHFPGTVVGEVIMEISHTDVALVKLTEGIEFINEPFENTLVPIPPFKLAEFARAVETRIGDNVFLDSPFSGFVEGTRGAHSLLRIPSDNPHGPEQIWIKYKWDYMGQGSNESMVDGVCGSAIWDEKHRVLGFFQYAPKSGSFVDWCYSISADHLLDQGYKMA